ncbi:MAG: hypothetical protein ABI557_05570 [Aureliella sp.]
MNYVVLLSLEAVEDVLRITMGSQSKLAVVNASKQVQEAVTNDPAIAGVHLSEGLYFIDREPLRAFYTIDVEELLVEIVSVKEV